jgi:trimethylamine--corrinoid protein Co-methyltransferase
MVRRFMEGVEVSEETLALDVIDRVGPGGHFLGEMHTLQHFRENWYPRLFDRRNRAGWETGGSLTLGERARAKVLDILENRQPPPLDEAVSARLDAVLRRAEASRRG